jgi:putative FmdB family regulatory protein
MPTYDYECRACGHCFEAFQSMAERRLRTCPACGKPSLLRLVGAGAGVIFKGSGFYETDYKRAGSRDPSAAGTAGKGPSDSGTSRDAAPKPGGGSESEGGGDGAARGTKPDSRGAKPETRGAKPESRGAKPESRGAKPGRSSPAGGGSGGA